MAAAMTDNLYDLLRQRFPADLGRPCIETAEGHIYTYADVENISGRFARLLEQFGVTLLSFARSIQL